MSRQPVHDFECPVVKERVRVALRARKAVGLRQEKGYFVQCDQVDCQYAAENKPPCPLDPSMFADEIAAIEERNRQLRERR